MPCIIHTLTPAGLQPADYTAESLADAARHEPRTGVYTITNTFESIKVLRLDAHLDRLEDSARRSGIPLTLDRPRLRAALRQMIDDSGFGNVRFRITVPADAPSSLILSIEPFHGVAPALYEQGVHLQTTHAAARDNPAAKTTAWMHDRAALDAQRPAGIYEMLLTDADGTLLEGTSSNFYAVLDGELRTAGDGVLAGIAQQIVFEIAPPLLPVRREAVRIDAIPRFSEAFITSSSRGIVPVVRIDGIVIGPGTPGTHTRALRTAYADWMRTHLETL
ncbi:MAG: aminotransferase class IV [bacterium]|nr:aminotransferase class IV [bacterium]